MKIKALPTGFGRIGKGRRRQKEVEEFVLFSLNWWWNIPSEMQCRGGFKILCWVVCMTTTEEDKIVSF